MTATDLIRNFSIIAHIDHGKSTLADRLIQLCGNVSDREMKDQILDSMDIERERGITIKAQTVRLDYKAKDGKTYQLNLIDTPGHVDFAYEVSRSLAACEGAVLVVDATQGVEAQTLANVYQALDNNLEIVPVLNKIDLPAADPDRVKAADRGGDRPRRLRRHSDLGQDRAKHRGRAGSDCGAAAGAKGRRQGAAQGAPDRQLVRRLPRRRRAGARHRRRLKKGQRIKLMASGGVYQVERVGIFRPKQETLDELGPGEVGFFTAADQAGGRHACRRHGHRREGTPTASPLPGFKPAQPVVFCGLFPVDAARFEDLREAMAQLRLNDASFTYEMETSAALGFGFRCGFLGLLHLEIITRAA